MKHSLDCGDGERRARCYILIVSYNVLFSSDQSVELEDGTLLQEVVRSGDFIQAVVLSSNKESPVVSVPLHELEELSHLHLQLLLAVKVSQRMQLHRNKTWMREGEHLATGSRVLLCNDESRDLAGASGVVRYKGNLPTKHGIWFGVELSPQYAGRGTSNGVFRKQQYFSCAEDCAVFVNLFRLRRDSSDVSLSSLRISNTVDTFDSDFDSEQSCNTSSFAVGDRVVWMSDHGPEVGTIRWKGVLPDSLDKQLIAGVEFDRPVGTGTGRYHGQQLFTTARGHASLMPALGLMHYRDFFGHDEPTPNRSRSSASKTSDVSDPLITSAVEDQSSELSRYAMQPMSTASSSERYVEKRQDRQPVVRSRFSGVGPSPTGSMNLSLRENAHDDPALPSSTYLSGASLSRSMHVAPNSQRFMFNSFQPNQQPARPMHPTAINYTESSGLPSENSDSGIAGSFSTNVSSNFPPSQVKRDSGLASSQLSVRLNDRVFVTLDRKRYGVVRYIGPHPRSSERTLVGLEMEEADPLCYTDGTFNKVKYFSCAPKSALFADLNKVRPDDRAWSG